MEVLKLRHIIMPTKKPRIMVSIDDDLLKMLDDYRRRQEIIPSRSEAIRHFIERALREESEREKGA